jgi:DNA transposition AAA+ family ATPase
MIKAIREFLAVERDRYESGGNKFVVTPTAKACFNAVELARESQSPVILHGPSHIGKTWALRYHSNHENHGRTPMAELDAACGLGGMVRIIARALGISHNGNTADLIERIKRGLAPNMVLILDELHLLKNTYRINSFFSCMEVIRRIYDFTECGMVLSWTHLDNLTGNKDRELQQIWRRGVHKIALPAMPTKADLAVILKFNGLEFPDAKQEVTVHAVTERPYEVLRQVAKRDGLKAITERLRYGRKLAGRNGDKLAWDHFIDAHLRIEKQAQPTPDWN